MNSYIPKFLSVDLPVADLDLVELNLTYVPEIKQAMKDAWDKAFSLGLEQDRKPGGFYKYHRGNLTIHGDEGYIRTALFMSVFLNKTFNGSPYYVHIPKGGSNAVLSRSLMNVVAGEAEGEFQISGTTNAALQFFWRNRNFHSFIYNNMNIEEIKANVDVICESPFLNSSFAGATFFNLLKYNLMLVRMLWLSQPVEGTKTDFNLNYRNYDLFAVQNDQDFEDLFRAYINSSTHLSLLDGIAELSSVGRHIKLTPNGALLGEQFGKMWTDRVIDLAVKSTNNAFLLRVEGSSFFSELPRYALLARVAERFPEMFNIKPKFLKGLGLIEHIESIEIERTAIDSWITTFETRYSELLSLYSSMVDEFFVEIDDNTPVLPNVVAYATAIEGKDVIYGLKVCSPYNILQYNGVIYADGDLLTTTDGRIVDGRKPKIVRTQFIDESKVGIDLYDITNRAPNYLQTLLRVTRYVEMLRDAPTSLTVHLQYKEDYTLVIPPLNPVAKYNFGDRVLTTAFVRDPENFLTVEVSYEDLMTTPHNLLLVITEAQARLASSSSYSNEALGSILFSNFERSLIGINVGVERKPYLAKTFRAAVMTLSSLLATSDLASSDNIIKYVSVSVNDEVLNRREIRSSTTIHRRLLVPFPFHSAELTSAQISSMRTYANQHPDNLGIGSTATDVLAGDGYMIYENEYYTPYTDIFKRGIAEIRVGRSIIPGFSSKVSITRDDLVYNMYSLIHDVSDEAIGTFTYLATNEQDAYDPVPHLNAESASVYLLSSIISDILLANAAGSQYNTGANFANSALMICDIYDFWTRCLKSQGRVMYSTPYIIDKTWGDMAKIFEPAVEAAELYIADLNNAFDPATGVTNVTLINAGLATDFTGSFLHACSQIRPDSSLFWSDKGFIMNRLYFGCTKQLLEDKFYHRLRRALPLKDFMDLRFIPIPQSNNAMNSQLIRHHIVLNLNILLHNILGKAIYRRGR